VSNLLDRCSCAALHLHLHGKQFMRPRTEQESATLHTVPHPLQQEHCASPGASCADCWGDVVCRRYNYRYINRNLGPQLQTDKENLIATSGLVGAK
jgi:hypothetical protein